MTANYVHLIRAATMLIFQIKSEVIPLFFVVFYCLN